MTTPLTDEAAWRHLLELGAGGAGEVGPLRIEPDGTWTASGQVDGDAATVLDVFAPLQVRARFVVGQLGQSLDGRIATTGGHSHYINGPEDLARLHRLRALSDAVIVGAGTVASDDPRLTVRRVQGESPTRVVLDSSARLDPGLGVFSDGAAPTLWLRPEGAGSRSSRPGDGTSARGDHVEVVTLPVHGRGFRPEAVLGLLAERGLGRVLVEGGGLTVSSFLAAGVLDRLHVSVAPLLLGSGRPSFTLPPIETLDQALRPPVRHFCLGDDLLFDLALEG